MLDQLSGTVLAAQKAEDARNIWLRRLSLTVLQGSTHCAMCMVVIAGMPSLAGLV